MASGTSRKYCASASRSSGSKSGHSRRLARVYASRRSQPVKLGRILGSPGSMRRRESRPSSLCPMGLRACWLRPRNLEGSARDRRSRALCCPVSRRLCGSCRRAPRASRRVTPFAGPAARPTKSHSQWPHASHRASRNTFGVPSARRSRAARECERRWSGWPVHRKPTAACSQASSRPWNLVCRASWSPAIRRCAGPRSVARPGLRRRAAGGRRRHPRHGRRPPWRGVTRSRRSSRITSCPDGSRQSAPPTKYSAAS